GVDLDVESLIGTEIFRPETTRLEFGAETIPAEAERARHLGAIKHESRVLVPGEVHIVVGRDLVLRAGGEDARAETVEPAADVTQPLLLKERDPPVGRRADVQKQVAAAGDGAHEQLDDLLAGQVVVEL